MALTRKLLTRRRILAAALETTNGTDAVPDATGATFKVYNPSMEPEVAILPRELNGSPGNDTAVPASRWGTATFELDLKGKGATSAVPDWADLLLPACDWARGTNTTFTACGGTSTSTVSLYLYEDGYVRKLVGCKGDFELNFRAGEPGRIKFSFQGKYTGEADAAIIAPTQGTIIAPAWSNGTFTLGATNVAAASLTLKAGNAIAKCENATDSSGTGFECAAITNYNPTGSMDPEMALAATRAWYADLIAGTTRALSVVLGATQYNIITIAAAAAQLMKKGRGDRNGLAVESLDLSFNGVSPFTIGFS